MLLFIYCGFVEGVVQQIFQNISCYCLSMNIIRDLTKVNLFQNISCYCLSGTRTNAFHVSYEFQNISCYCLSGNVYEKIILPSYFKTSHVIVYQLDESGKCAVSIFQNISCYCLSLAFPRFLVSPLPFFPLYFLYFSIFYQPTPLSWTALLIIP